LIEKYIAVTEKEVVFRTGANPRTMDQFSKDAEYLLMIHNQAEEVVSLLKRSSVIVKTGKGKLLDEGKKRICCCCFFFSSYFFFLWFTS
jgi:hypothetical protein